MKFRHLFIIAVIIVFGVFIVSIFVTSYNDFTMGNADREIIIVPQEYEVTNVYRVYDGNKLQYGVDYIDSGTILTLVLPTYYNKIVVIPNHVNDTYLVYKEEWILYENGEMSLGKGKGNYELHLSSNTSLCGAPTSFSRVKMNDLHTTVITT